MNYEQTFGFEQYGIPEVAHQQLPEYLLFFQSLDTPVDNMTQSSYNQVIEFADTLGAEILANPHIAQELIISGRAAIGKSTLMYFLLAYLNREANPELGITEGPFRALARDGWFILVSNLEWGYPFQILDDDERITPEVVKQKGWKPTKARQEKQKEIDKVLALYDEANVAAILGKDPSNNVDLVPEDIAKREDYIRAKAENKVHHFVIRNYLPTGFPDNKGKMKGVDRGYYSNKNLIASRKEFTDLYQAYDTWFIGLDALPEVRSQAKKKRRLEAKALGIRNTNANPSEIDEIDKEIKAAIIFLLSTLSHTYSDPNLLKLLVREMRNPHKLTEVLTINGLPTVAEELGLSSNRCIFLINKSLYSPAKEGKETDAHTKAASLVKEIPIINPFVLLYPEELPPQQSYTELDESRIPKAHFERPGIIPPAYSDEEPAQPKQGFMMDSGSNNFSVDFI